MSLHHVALFDSYLVNPYNMADDAGSSYQDDAIANSQRERDEWGDQGLDFLDAHQTETAPFTAVFDGYDSPTPSLGSKRGSRPVSRMSQIVSDANKRPRSVSAYMDERVMKHLLHLSEEIRDGDLPVISDTMSPLRLSPPAIRYASPMRFPGPSHIDAAVPRHLPQPIAVRPPRAALTAASTTAALDAPQAIALPRQLINWKRGSVASRYDPNVTSSQRQFLNTHARPLRNLPGSDLEWQVDIATQLDVEMARISELISYVEEDGLAKRITDRPIADNLSSDESAAALGTYTIGMYVRQLFIVVYRRIADNDELSNRLFGTRTKAVTIVQCLIYILLQMNVVGEVQKIVYFESRLHAMKRIGDLLRDMEHWFPYDQQFRYVDESVNRYMIRKLRK